ncbi:MAG: hypothetical protein AAGE61_04670 [Pseudomonadota bacterium]
MSNLWPPTDTTAAPVTATLEDGDAAALSSGFDSALQANQITGNYQNSQNISAANNTSLTAGAPDPEPPIIVPNAAALAKLSEWLSTGLISEAQFSKITADPALLAQAEAVVTAGSGRIEVISEGEARLRDITSQTFDEIKVTLDRGFDLATGPSDDQFAALNTLAQGDTNAFFALLIGWTQRQHPDLKLRFNPATKELKFVSNTLENEEDSEFLNFIIDNLGPKSIIRSMGYRKENLDSGANLSYFDYKKKRDRSGNSPSIVYSDKWYEIKPAQDVTGLFGNQFNKKDALWSDANPDRDKAFETVMHILNFEKKYELPRVDTGRLNNNFLVGTKDYSDRGLGGKDVFLREIFETSNPELLTGADVIVYNVDGARVENVSGVGNFNVVFVGSDNVSVDTGQGDVTGNLREVSNVSVNSKSGSTAIFGERIVGLTLLDRQIREGNATLLALQGVNRDINIDADEGETAVVVGSGTTSNLKFVAEDAAAAQLDVLYGATLENSEVQFDDTDGKFTAHGGSRSIGVFVNGRDGEDAVVIGSGAIFADGKIRVGDDDDTFIAEEGSFVLDSKIHGGDDDDTFLLAGVLKKTLVKAGKDNDYIQINDTFRGDFSLEDSAAAWMWAGDDEAHEFDTVALEGEGWDLLDTPDGKKLVARDDYGGILGQVNLKGDSDELESIYTFNEDGMISSLQYIAPEIRTKLSWLGFASTALMIAGTFFPPAAIAGAVTKFVYDAANDQISLRNGLSTAATVAGAYGITAAAPAVDTAFAIEEGDIGGILIGGARTTLALNNDLTKTKDFENAEAFDGANGFDGTFEVHEGVNFGDLSSTAFQSDFTDIGSVVGSFESSGVGRLITDATTTGSFLSDQAVDILEDIVEYGPGVIDAVETGDFAPLVEIATDHISNKNTAAWTHAVGTTASDVINGHDSVQQFLYRASEFGFHAGDRTVEDTAAALFHAVNGDIGSAVAIGASHIDDDQAAALVQALGATTGDVISGHTSVEQFLYRASEYGFNAGERTVEDTAAALFHAVNGDIGSAVAIGASHINDDQAAALVQALGATTGDVISGHTSVEQFLYRASEYGFHAGDRTVEDTAAALFHAVNGDIGSAVAIGASHIDDDQAAALVQALGATAGDVIDGHTTTQQFLYRASEYGFHAGDRTVEDTAAALFHAVNGDIGSAVAIGASHIDDDQAAALVQALGATTGDVIDGHTTTQQFLYRAAEYGFHAGDRTAEDTAAALFHAVNGNIKEAVAIGAWQIDDDQQAALVEGLSSIVIDSANDSVDTQNAEETGQALADLYGPQEQSATL